MDELTSTRNSPSERRKEQRYYWCSRCKSYHLTSKT